MKTVTCANATDMYVPSLVVFPRRLDSWMTRHQAQNRLVTRLVGSRKEVLRSGSNIFSAV